MSGSAPEPEPERQQQHQQNITRDDADENGQQEPNQSNGRVSSSELPSNERSAQMTSAPEPQQPKPGFLAGLVGKLGLDAGTIISMLKGALAPVIGLAIYQSDAISQEFSTFGYIVGIVAVLSLSVLPRGKFIQTLVFNLLFLSIGSAVSLLMLWSSLQARLHTQIMPSDPRGPPTYNSSQSAVSAIWLFANIWIVNTLRAKYPSLNIPSIVYSILTNISCTLSPQITSNAAFLSIIKRLLTAMLLGFGIGTAVALLVFPISSRAVWTAQLQGVIQLLRGAVNQEKTYLQSLEREDMFAIPADICAATHVSHSDDSVDGESIKTSKKKAQPAPKSTAEAEAIKKTMFNLRLLSSKLVIDLPFAKRDIAWAKLPTKDLTTINELIRGVVIPVHGMGTVIDIFQRLAEKRGWITTSETPLEVLAEKMEEKRVWNEVMKQLHEPFEQLSISIDEGLQHAGMLLEILPSPKATKKSRSNTGESATSADVESKGDLVQPGDAGFTEALKKKVQSFRDVRGAILRAWAKEKGLLTADSTLDDLKSASLAETGTRHSRDREQLYILLYIETLMEAAGEGVLRVVQFADSKVADGTMSRKKLMVPKPKVLRKWVESVFSDEDQGQENNTDVFESGLSTICMGDSFAQKKDPEHLPATNFWQRAGNALRALSKFFSSEESAFGFRCACATLTVGIVAFLEQTHVFFQEQRLVWAMIIIAIGMTQTSGQSIFGFACRILGTLVAAIFSLITWYIVDENVPGIFVFLYLFLAINIYFLLKFPQFIPAIVLCMVTQVLIIGYELQVVKIGIKLSESNGQPYYPIYLLAPYRLATVAGGCAVAFFWTIFPSPVTERTWLRRDLAATLYLIANYFSVINETLRSKLDGTGGDRNIKGTPAHHLAKHRLRLFGKLMMILPSLKQHADFQRWEPTIGGKFPRELYEDIILRASRINSYLTLLSYTIGGGGKGTPWMTFTDALDAVSSTTGRPSQSNVRPGGRFQGANNNNSNGEDMEAVWRDALAVLLANISPTQHSVICTLTLLSNALQSGHSIPPHLTVPRPFELSRQLEALGATRRAKAAVRYQDSISGSSDVSTNTGPDEDTGEDSSRVNKLLDVRNMTQEGYAEFAVLQVCSLLVCDDLEGLIESVSKLVGVVDFSYHVGNGNNKNNSSSSGSSMLSNIISGGGDVERGGGARGKGKVD